MITKYICKNKEESKYICNVFNHKYINDIEDSNFPITIYFKNKIYDGWCQSNCNECFHFKECDTSTKFISETIIVTKLMRKNKLKRILNKNTVVESDEFELNFCNKCFQMTNHKNGICQKCKNKEDKIYDVNNINEKILDFFQNMNIYPDNVVDLNTSKYLKSIGYNKPSHWYWQDKDLYFVEKGLKRVKIHKRRMNHNKYDDFIYSAPTKNEVIHWLKHIKK